MITLFKKLRIMINQLDIVYGMAAHPTYDVSRIAAEKNDRKNNRQSSLRRKYLSFS